MAVKNWKRVQPRSLREALELCKDHALAVHHRSVERIAELAGEESHWTVYGWLRDGSIPGKKIMAYQHACGCDFITRWMANTSGKLLIDIPTGRKARPTEIPALYQKFSDVTAALAGFYEGDAEAQETISRITELMEGLAWHRANVEKHVQPEFEFGGEA